HIVLLAAIPIGCLAILFAPLGIFGALLAVILTLGGIRFYLKNVIKKRKENFLKMLPDALDISIRSVRDGYPIVPAIGMVADSLPPEIGAEYLRIMQEASYGYTLGEAVSRFADRMQDPDVSFFSVVVNLQQETGGNLAEVLSNLSYVIRQRQQLKL